MFLMFVMNIGSEKSSKAFGTTGMVLKTIPLFTVIIMAFVAFGTGAGQMPNDVPIDGTDTDFSMIILALPGIMFAFDGFVYSASMQNEAKDQKTFMTA
jgi:amino acid transporter